MERAMIKTRQHTIDDQCGGPWIKPDESKGQPSDKLHERYNNGNQVDEHGREKDHIRK